MGVLKTAGRYPILPRGFESLALRFVVIMHVTWAFVASVIWRIGGGGICEIGGSENRWCGMRPGGPRL